MEVSHHLHGPNAVRQRTKLQYLLVTRLQRPQSLSGRGNEEKNLYLPPPTGNQNRHSVPSPVIILTELHRLLGTYMGINKNIIE